jgi:D-threonate/D-erythronate kinase
MILLAIISDDFTGALDTGVQFSKYGVSVKILTLDELQNTGFPKDFVDVLVVDAETRHILPDKAYSLTLGFVMQALEASVPHIYVKTDSGLRGNIGSVLKAALDASRENFLAFLPAFPDMNRITQNGMHFIDQIPIHKSAFGTDPFDPVQSPYVKDLFKGLDVETAIMKTSDSYDTNFKHPTIGIFDVRTNSDFRRIASHLKSHNQLEIVAGCAGFASILPEFMSFPPHDAERQIIIKPLLIVCGSLSPVTRRQVEYAQKHGFTQISLTPQQLLNDGYFFSPEGIEWLSSRQALFCGSSPIVIDTGISNPEQMRKYDSAYPAAKEINKDKIAIALGSLLKQLLVLGYCRKRTLMVIGGDTLLGFIRQFRWHDISPIAELELGTVLTCIRAEGQSIQVISKSGSFGETDLLVKIAKKTLP